MNIQPNQHIKCIFRNGTVIEGIAQSWSKEEAILLSLNDGSLMVILHPGDDVMLVKIMPKEVAEPTDELLNEIEALEPKPQFPLEVSEEDSVSLLEDPLTLQAKSIAELKIEMAKQERKIIAGKLKDHHPDASQIPRKVKYGYPGFFKKPSAQ